MANNNRSKIDDICVQESIIEPEQKQDASSVEKLYDLNFRGATRWRRPIYQLRTNTPPVGDLCYVIRWCKEQGGEQQIIAALRFWQVRILSQEKQSTYDYNINRDGTKDALLFGPLAVDCEMQGLGLGKKLVQRGIEDARRLQHGGILISGASAYYRPFGFKAACVANIAMPQPSPGHVLMGLELKPNYLSSAKGKVFAEKIEVG